jgi:hypothetical protein
MAFRCRVQLKVLSRYVASTGIVQDTISLQGPCRSYPGGILVTLEIHLLFAADTVYPVMGVLDEYWGEYLW